jgi:hypothetical protein
MQMLSIGLGANQATGLASEELGNTTEENSVYTRVFVCKSTQGGVTRKQCLRSALTITVWHRRTKGRGCKNSTRSRKHRQVHWYVQ